MNTNQLERLKSQTVKNKDSNMISFENLILIYLDVKAVKHFPKIKKNDGTSEKSNVADGLTYTFSEFNTSKMVKVVSKNNINLEVLTAYKLSGKGYEFKQSNMIYIAELEKIEVF